MDCPFIVYSSRLDEKEARHNRAIHFMRGKPNYESGGTPDRCPPPYLSPDAEALLATKQAAFGAWKQMAGRYAPDFVGPRFSFNSNFNS